ncbi:hypothetical protein A6769_26985 [Nostoc punctiforme NIES-2108]|uniref:Uncharacterized protein n=1 Tax=Nostoc punctiforme NIES-2108 TaxID=1356359 RepID=A0A367RAE6_NOSPU|nr:hypothetical protein A6769_26985 [Nostoc punctiforme NIES-2108]
MPQATAEAQRKQREEKNAQPKRIALYLAPHNDRQKPPYFIEKGLEKFYIICKSKSVSSS